MESNSSSRLSVQPDGPDLPESNEGIEGGFVDGASMAMLKRGYTSLDVVDDPYVSIFTPEPGFGGFAGRPHGWER